MQMKPIINYYDIRCAYRNSLNLRYIYKLQLLFICFKEENKLLPFFLNIRRLLAPFN